jgi:hypothetical protein
MSLKCVKQLILQGNSLISPAVLWQKGDSCVVVKTLTFIKT